MNATSLPVTSQLHIRIHQSPTSFIIDPPMTVHVELTVEGGGVYIVGQCIQCNVIMTNTSDDNDRIAWATGQISGRITYAFILFILFSKIISISILTSISIKSNVHLSVFVCVT